MMHLAACGLSEKEDLHAASFFCVGDSCGSVEVNAEILRSE